MSGNLPNMISKGHVSRLFPSLSETNKEMRATSTFLSVIRGVPELLSVLVSSIGVSINDRTTLQAYTEVIPTKGLDKEYRPDGLLYVKNRKVWSCFIEAKVGKSELESSQLEHYVRLAKLNGVDAVLTISNEFSARLDQSPVELSRRTLGKIRLLHLSWREILSTSEGMLSSGQNLDREKRFLLEEFARFLRDQGVGNTDFSAMPRAWAELNDKISAKTKISHRDPSLYDVATALQQQYSEMAIILTEHLGVQCKLRLSRDEKKDRHKWTERIQKNIASSGVSYATFEIPNAAADLNVQVDIGRGSIRMSVELWQLAPKKTPYGKAAWVVNQIPDINRGNLLMSIRWNTRAKNLDIKASELSREVFKGHSAGVKSISIKRVTSDQGKFKSRKKFVKQIEQELTSFYDDAVQHLKPYVAKAPSPKMPRQSNIGSNISQGAHKGYEPNIPDFLKRI